jgi:hypothetical protein
MDLAGYSFGAWVNALGLAKFEEAQRFIMVSPPVSFIDFSFLEYSPKIKLVICGTRDEIAEYKKVEKMLPKWNDQALFRVIEGADHFYSGYEEELKEIIGLRQKVPKIQGVPKLEKRNTEIRRCACRSQRHQVRKNKLEYSLLFIFFTKRMEKPKSRLK